MDEKRWANITHCNNKNKLQALDSNKNYSPIHACCPLYVDPEKREKKKPAIFEFVEHFDEKRLAHKTFSYQNTDRTRIKI